jgi:hypothetical protein
MFSGSGASLRSWIAFATLLEIHKLRDEKGLYGPYGEESPAGAKRNRRTSDRRQIGVARDVLEQEWLHQRPATQTS